MESNERKLLLELAAKILELQYRTEALADILRSQFGVTADQLRATVEKYRVARESALRSANRTQEEILLDLLAGFEGPKQ